MINPLTRNLARNTGRLLALNHKHHRKQWIPEERFELVSKFLAGFSIQETACNAGIDSGQLYQWVKKYKLFGYNGLENKPMKLFLILHTNKVQAQNEVFSCYF